MASSEKPTEKNLDLQSNLGLNTRTQPSAPSGLSEILSYIAHMAEAGSQKTKSQFSVATIIDRKKALISLARKVEILDAEAVKSYLLSCNLSKGRKNKLIQDLKEFYKHVGIQFELLPFREGQKLPTLPLECDVRFLISKLGRKTCCFTQAIYETGARPLEIWNQEWRDTQLTKCRINISHPGKCANGRSLGISPTLVGMLELLPRKGMFLFHSDRSGNSDPSKGLKDFMKSFSKQRRRIANESGNDRIRLITWRSLRHLKGTNEYSKSLDILHVKDVLGHRTLKNTLVYVHLASDGYEEHYDCKTARTPEERTALIELGYNLVEKDADMWYFKKRRLQ